MDKFYTCKYDHCFKSTFIDNPDVTLLKDLLEFVLKIKLNEIKIINGEQSKDNINLKRGLLDCLIDTDFGRIALEVNSKYYEKMYLKNINYFFDEVSHYFKVGEKYNLKKYLIQINFTYGLGEVGNEIREEYFVMNRRGRKLRKDVYVIEINMDQIEKIWYDQNIEEIKKYVPLIELNRDREELEYLSKIDKGVEKFMKRVEKVNEEPEFRVYMEKEELDKRMLDIIEQTGEEKGLNKSAKNMIKKRFDINIISEITGLSEKEIMNLKNNIVD